MAGPLLAGMVTCSGGYGLSLARLLNLGNPSKPDSGSMELSAILGPTLSAPVKYSDCKEQRGIGPGEGDQTTVYVLSEHEKGS